MTGSALEYKDGTTVLEGYLAVDQSSQKKRPGVLVFHEWMGVADHEKAACDDLAKAGYIALAGDIFGKGKRPASMEEAAQNANHYRAGDRALMRQRTAAALTALRAQPLCDGRVAAIGFCFGGTCALELARSGADIKGVVTFHGGLNTQTPAAANTLKAKILALHGAEDPFVPAAEVTAFQDEMRKAKADWQFMQYSGAVHSFTNPGAGNQPEKGFAYNATAAKRSWQAMLGFFAEIFA
ncbi:MAG: dienelactone hydrolase family protein [Gammaproteobacteria bacterium]|nr:dienelactone hydrolase family protein [Gammaproteobacteria bacterium]